MLNVCRNYRIVIMYINLYNCHLIQVYSSIYVITPTFNVWNDFVNEYNLHTDLNHKLSTCNESLWQLSIMDFKPLIWFKKNSEDLFFELIIYPTICLFQHRSPKFLLNVKIQSFFFVLKRTCPIKVKQKCFLDNKYF